jgi:hypothetical protein
MRLTYLLIPAVLAVGLSGCGGAGGFGPFTGTFNGTWSQTGPPDHGAASFHILPGGTLQGEMHDQNTNSNYSISGTMDETGQVNATLGPGDGTLTGQLSDNISGELIGTLTNNNGPLNSPEFILVQQ